MKSLPILLEKGRHCCPVVTCATVPGAAALDEARVHPRVTPESCSGCACRMPQRNARCWHCVHDGNTLLSPAELLNSVLAPALFQGTAVSHWIAPPEERGTFKCLVTSWDVRVLFSLADLICSISGNKGGLSQ